MKFCFLGLHKTEVVTSQVMYTGWSHRVISFSKDLLTTCGFWEGSHCLHLCTVGEPTRLHWLSLKNDHISCLGKNQWTTKQKDMNVGNSLIGRSRFNRGERKTRESTGVKVICTFYICVLTHQRNRSHKKEQWSYLKNIRNSYRYQNLIIASNKILQNLCSLDEIES